MVVKVVLAVWGAPWDQEGKAREGILVRLALEETEVAQVMEASTDKEVKNLVEVQG